MTEGGRPLESLATMGDYVDPGLCITLGLIAAFLAGLLTAALHKFSPARLMMRLEKGQADDSVQDRAKHLADELDEADLYLPGASFLKLAGLGMSLIGAINLQAGATFWPEGVPGLLLLFVLAALFSEVLPDRITDFRAESIVYRGLPLLRLSRYMLIPATWPLSRISKVFVRNFLGIREEYEQAKDRDELADEIRAAVEDSDEREVLAAEEKEWIENIVEFREQDVANVMTPRTDIVAVEARAPFKKAIEVGVKAGHSRLPVYEDKLDNIVGIFYLRDAIAQVAREEAGRLEAEVGEHSRPPYFVPESKKVTNLLREFKTRRVQIAIVVDEYGGTAGLICVEDILEEIVGDIDDEYDVAREDPLVILEKGRLAEIDGKIKVDDLNEALGTDLPESEDYETVGGFVFSHLGRIPKSGDTFTYESTQFRILQAGPRNIERMKVKVLHEQRAGT